jgi:hypothetical protein
MNVSVNTQEVGTAVIEVTSSAAPEQLRCRYCKEPMERRITRNRYTRKPAPGDVCSLCLKDDAIDYAGVEFIRGER